MTRPASPPPPSEHGILVGLEAIGSPFGRSPEAISRWIRDYGFPAKELPDGTLCTSLRLIDRWLEGP
jgi:hypothetical protein